MNDIPAQTVTPFPWMRMPSVIRVMAALDHETARFVGGAVRDSLLGRPFEEIDIATTLPPATVMEKLGAVGIETIPTGLAHGTVTAVLPDRRFEITTLRRDVATDGRHAQIAPTGDWTEDARRRDFTMNALYLDMAGNLYDPVGGLPDVHDGRVRFVGDPETRIREDVLRLLRFYRFLAYYNQGEPDAAARAACRKLAPLLPQLSAERVHDELKKLLLAPDPVPAIELMAEDGVLARVIPEATRLDRLRRLVAIEPEPNSVRRLAALTALDRAGVAAMSERLRLSNAAKERLEALALPGWPIDLSGSDRRQRRALYRLGLRNYRDLVLLTGDAARAPRLLAMADTFHIPTFPLKGGDVIALGVAPGPEIGRILAAVESWWEEEDFIPGPESCLAEARKLIKSAS